MANDLLQRKYLKLKEKYKKALVKIDELETEKQQLIEHHKSQSFKLIKKKEKVKESLNIANDLIKQLQKKLQKKLHKKCKLLSKYNNYKTDSRKCHQLLYDVKLFFEHWEEHDYQQHLLSLLYIRERWNVNLKYVHEIMLNHYAKFTE